jgi:hypothetical protein
MSPNLKKAAKTEPQRQHRLSVVAADKAPPVVEAPKELSTREQKTAELQKLSAELGKLMQQVAGVKGPKHAELLFRQIELMNRPWVKRDDAHDACDVWKIALEMISSLQPKDSVQAMLAVQMLGIHSAATAALAQTSTEGIDGELAELYINRATRLMRLFTTQAELMARLQGKITTQKVVVERIDMAAGSQAVVGVVETAKERG